MGNHSVTFYARSAERTAGSTDELGDRIKGRLIQKKEDKRKPVNIPDRSRDIAFFIWFYGVDLYQNDFYTTDNKVIPHKLFLLYLNETPKILAHDKLHLARAIRLGAGWTMDPTSSGFRKEFKAIVNEAGGD